jgi:CDP-6-deoxy-D-xylo-4-hexulose-3-dehydrase
LEAFTSSVPYVDKRGTKVRPVLITSEPNSKGDVLSIPGSTQLLQWQESAQIVLYPGDLATGSLNFLTQNFGIYQ